MPFISFEGLEGCGKSTLIKGLHQGVFSNYPHVVLTKAPGGTQIGSVIRQLLLDREHLEISFRTELFLFLADLAQLVQETVLPALKKGWVVLCDRFIDSTVAYQGKARGFDPQWIETLISFATQNLVPDVTLYIDINPEDGLSRIKRSKDRMEMEPLTFYQTIRNQYLALAKQFPKRFFLLDGTKEPDNLYEDACRILQPYWKRNSKANSNAMP